jgi:hypothetical protein
VLFSALAELLEDGEAALVAAHGLAVDQAGPHLEVVHGLHDEREAVCPVVSVAGDEPDAHGVAPGHHPVAVVLDLMNPVCARRRLVGGRWQARFNEAGGSSARRRTQRGHGGKIVRRMRNASPETVMQTQHLAQIRETTISGNGAQTIFLFSVSDCRSTLGSSPPAWEPPVKNPVLGALAGFFFDRESSRTGHPALSRYRSSGYPLR